MKYKLLKYIEKVEDSMAIGETVELDCTHVELDNGGRIAIDFLLREGYLQEINTGPKFKVGGYVVYTGSSNCYIKIYQIKDTKVGYIYNISLNEKELRYPTEEELKKYFR